MKLSQDELYSLVKSLSKIDVSELTVKSKDLTIKIKHGSSAVSKKDTVTNESIEIINDETAEVKSESGITIKAPIHGTFYSSPSPDKPSFVKVGDKVKVGQTICILEAMKMMNTVNIPEDGVITSIEAINEEIVDAGQVLVRYIPE
jgi:acetyl-CoA carboxylase biotin carboxyl carrier protein